MNKRLKKKIAGKIDPFLFDEIDYQETGAGHHSGGAGGCRVIGITSSGHGEGKSFLSVLWASTEAGKRNRKVLVIDAGRPGRNSSSSILGMDNSRIYFEADENISAIDDFIEKHSDPEFSVLPGFSSSNHENIYRTVLIERLIRSQRQNYDLIIVDGTSLSDGISSYNLMKLCDGVMLCVEYGRFSHLKVKSYISRLEKEGIRITGAFLNRRRYPIPEFLYNII